MSRLLERLRIALIAFSLLAIPAAAAPVSTSAAANSESLAPIAMDGGGYVNCVIRTDRTLWCWGNGLDYNYVFFFPSNRLGQDGLNEPQQMGTDLWLSVSVGERNVCGIKIATRTSTQGGLYCFGSNQFGQLGVGASLLRLSSDFLQIGEETDWTALATGDGYVCGVRSGTLWCIGNNAEGQMGLGDRDSRSVLTDTTIQATAVSAASSATCVLTTEGAARCMGYNGSGQLGNGTTDNSTTVVDVSGTHRFSSIVTGNNFVCAVAKNSTDYPDDAGRAYCWGDNGLRQLGSMVGDSETTSANAPRAVDGDLRIAKLQAGNSHVCAVTTGGALYCWGNNGYQQAGGSAEASSVMPTRIGTATNWAQVATASTSSCAATAATARVPSAVSCWGDRTFLGHGQRSYFNTLVQLPGTDYLRVSTNALTRCVIRGAALPGRLYCWGENWSGSVGNGTTAAVRTPVELVNAAGWNNVTVGSDATCAVSGIGTLYCWGSNDYGRLGVGDSDPRLTPTQVGTDAGWSSVSLGQNSACAIRTAAGSSGVYCWGRDDDSGLLGNGPVLTEDVLSPTEILTASAGATFTKVSVGSAHACALESSGKLWCWGANSSGPFGGNLLGDGSGEDQPAPVRSFTGIRFTDVSAGISSTCAVVVGGDAVCWGFDFFGNLGDGNSMPDFFFLPGEGTNSASPGRSMVSVWAGLWSNCGIKRGGDLYCWGLSVLGILPTGTDLSSATPKKIGSGFSSVSMPAWFSSSGGCALKTDGTLWCWGDSHFNLMQNGWVDQYGTPQSVKILYHAPTADGDAQITGRAKRGATLTADAPTFSGTPIPAVSYQWYRCTAAARSGAASVPRTCSKISGATRSTYVLQRGDVNKYVRLLVTAKSNAGTVTVMSPSTSKVAN